MNDTATSREEGGHFFRLAWIQGVQKHYPGTPKEGYIRPWEKMDSWEQESAMTVFHQTRSFILASRQQGQLSREQGGRLIRIAWVAQMYRHFQSPKSSYVCDWDDPEMSGWEKEVDMDIFEAIAAAVQKDTA